MAPGIRHVICVVGSQYVHEIRGAGGIGSVGCHGGLKRKVALRTIRGEIVGKFKKGPAPWGSRCFTVASFLISADVDNRVVTGGRDNNRGGIVRAYRITRRESRKVLIQPNVRSDTGEGKKTWDANQRDQIPNLRWCIVHCWLPLDRKIVGQIWFVFIRTVSFINYSGYIINSFSQLF